MQKSVFYYMRNNVFITTSGVFDQAAFACAVSALGIDNIMFSVDDPFSDNFEAIEFLNATQLSPENKSKLAYGNAERILHLSVPGVAKKNSTSIFALNVKSSIFQFKSSTKSKLGRMILSWLVK
jgi:hypothetical protein